jgi:hypothetical protein
VLKLQNFFLSAGSELLPGDLIFFSVRDVILWILNFDLTFEILPNCDLGLFGESKEQKSI